jgi:DNA-binding protein Fis
MPNDDNANRYRRAAELALEQLDWCINYLRSNRKTALARALTRNRDTIRRRLRELGS